MQSINYREQGTGPTVILIHGFPLNQHMWDHFAARLDDRLQVVTIDLPGFGKSAPLPAGFSIDDVADVLLAWTRQRGYQRPVVVGHSLGGYVALAMAGKDSASLGGLCLFHSTAAADSDEKKASRNKVLELIDRQGVQAFTSNFVGQLYADPRHSSIPLVKSIAVKATRETVTGYTQAMRDRNDRTDVLITFPRPILFLAGEKDQVIPVQTIRQQAALGRKTEAVVLPEVAHMGMFESEGPAAKNILKFVEQCAVTFPGATE